MNEIRIKDNETGEVFEYGSNKHHALYISANGGYLTFENLQNGCGSQVNGDGTYSFVLDDGKIPNESDSNDALYEMTYANIGGFKNPNFEKILFEIREEQKKYRDSWKKEIDPMQIAMCKKVYEGLKIAENIFIKYRV